LHIIRLIRNRFTSRVLVLVVLHRRMSEWRCRA
jgi:hypothetical protein